MKNGSRWPRRDVIAAVAKFMPAAMLAGPAMTRDARAAERIVVAAYGGSFAEGLDKAFFKSFTQETGIAVIQTPPVDPGKLKAAALVKAVDWDIIDFLATQVVTAKAEGLLQPIDYTIVQAKPEDFGDPKWRQDQAVAGDLYTGGIGYHKENQPNGRHPTTWQEFWDVEKFPGRRGIFGRPNDTFEIALLADGVSPDALYPIDVERAFRSLDRIKPHITKWTSSAPETVQLLQTKELDFVYTFANRVYAANVAGIPLGYAREQLMIFFDAYCVPKGAPNPKLAMRLLNHMMNPDRQLALWNEIRIIPTLKAALDRIAEADRKAWVPDMNSAKNLHINPDWWGVPGRLAELTTRFQNWLLG